ncbi:SGNH/GDSL hydrolase family protein [Streptomyces sp. bgisy091]|uniref:SGNH/GDSL hydrolase family protein n=1 Tax=Streptomyces sp. bgisy091 TaxID=3413778 RepID=UPI003D714CDD
MTVELEGTEQLLFQGDSITAAGRNVDDPTDLGHGYVRMVADRLASTHAGARVVNRGVSGNRVQDLRTRWATDTMDLRPDVLSVMIGVNDTWHGFEYGRFVPVEAYESDYRLIAGQARDAGMRLVLIEPFLVPVRPVQWDWRADLDGRVHAVRRLAAEFDAALLAADGLLNQAAREAGDPAMIAHDGVHLTELGHRILADAWTGLCAGRGVA